ncbi:MAG: hypothetical protein ACE5I0_10920 [Candidatus Binatia bacterium]
MKKGHDVHVYCQEFDEHACKGIVFHPIKDRSLGMSGRENVVGHSWDYACDQMLRIYDST